MKGIRPAVLLACLWLVFSSCFTVTVNAETVEENPVTSAGLETIIKNKDDNEVTISYVLENKKELILNTDQEKVIDIAALKEELGEDKVTVNDKKELVVTLDNPDLIDFKMHVDKDKEFLLKVLDADRKEIFNYRFNKEEELDTSETIDDEDSDDSDDGDLAEESTWIYTDKLRVSKGPILEHKDGSSTQPIFYFGDYIYAEKGIVSLSSTWEQRGKSRTNSLTAPNTGILYAEPGSRIEYGPTSPRNHIYTNHYGDNQKRDFDAPLTEEENLPYGSPTSYTSNNLFNFVVKTDHWKRPGTSGPNKIGKAYAMIGEPTLFYRINSKTGFEEQRLVYKQRAYYADKKDVTNPELTTSIKMSFTRTGRVVTNMSYKNTGKFLYNNFRSFSNHDLSLNKDGNELKDDNGRKIGNFISMRALGNERGMYIQAPNNEIRTNFYMNHKNGPKSWAARSASRSYLATKGYMYNPGVLGILFAQRETYYPWKVGKSRSHYFFDDKKNTYKFPYTPTGNFNAFEDQRDPGDKGKKFGAGKRLGTGNENDPQWDAGLTMQSNSTDLKPGRTIQMEYSTMTDIPGSTFNPVVDYDKLGTEDSPEVLLLGAKELELAGHWYDFDSNNVNIYYAVDDENLDKIKESILLSGRQSKDEAAEGKFHGFSRKVNINGLDKGMHKVFMIAEDEDGNMSILQEHNFKLVKPSVAKQGPQIDITSPNGTKRKPYMPMSDKFDLTGVWSDKKAKKIKTLSYNIDGGEEKIFAEKLSNPKLGNLIPWKIEDFDISKFNDFKIHLVTVNITDNEGMSDTDKFYFKHESGGTLLVAPAEIDFGNISVSLQSNQPQKPNLNGDKLLLEDFRKKGSKPLGVNLTVRRFYKQIGNSDGDDEDDGDDSASTVDPEDPEGGSESRSIKESLSHDVFWDGKAVSTKNLRVGQTEGVKEDKWHQTTDFTKDIEQKLKINFRSNETGSTPGKYVSYWTWSTVDSIG